MSNSRTMSVCICLGILLLSIFNTAMRADEPFIAGFDRFARHGEISGEIAGGLLVSELNCTACHLSSNKDFTPKMGPDLAGLFIRVNSDWVRKYLNDPQSQKPGNTMPEMFHGFNAQNKEAAIENILAYFQTQNVMTWPELKASGVDPIPDVFWEKGNAEQGKVLYHQVGCVACHAADPEYPVAKSKPSPLDQLLETLSPEEIKEMGLQGATRESKPIPHPKLEEKYNLQSLTFFLYKPELYRPGSRMPALKLKTMEAADIAAWLLRNQPVETKSEIKGNAQEGEKLIKSMGCASCHQFPGIKGVYKYKSWPELDFKKEKSCFQKGEGMMPRYSLDEAQLQSLAKVAGIQGEKHKLQPAEEAQAKMLKFNCYACHERDKLGGPARNVKPYFLTVNEVDIGDEGRVPPLLTFVGKKLKAEWFKKVLQGKGDIRPFMHTRMPIFNSLQINSLIQDFAQADGASSKQENEVFKSGKDLAKAGGLLMDTGCVQCHQFNQEVLPGVVGVDLDGISTRVQPQWFHDFIHDPNTLRPRTRMPTFFPNGKSSNPNVLDGDPELQIAAMWSYLKDLKNQELPDKITIAKSQDFELKPTDKPVILRTFMREAGTHAIAVGFPEHVHFTFDAENLKLVEGWRGRFIDARNTWFMRLIPPTDPLGDEHVTISQQINFAALKDTNEVWPIKAELKTSKFLGYKLDKEHVPTFMYEIEGVKIEEQIKPVKSDSTKYDLLRTIKLQAGQDNVEKRLYINLLVDKKLEKIDEASYQNSTGLKVSVKGENLKMTAPRTMGDQQEWIIPLEAGKSTMLEVRYSW